MHLHSSGPRATRHDGMVVVTALVLLWSIVAGGQHPLFHVAADDSALPSPAPTQGAGRPVRLQIATINLDAAIEAVGLASNGAMDTPQTPDDTAWYQLGPRPGEPGNAVIVGHVDSRAGTAVFWYLRTLTPGSMIVVTDDGGVTHQFVMRDAERYPLGSAPLTTIFGATDGSHLTLITCDADTPFDHASGEYAGHLVIYADAAP